MSRILHGKTVLSVIDNKTQRKNNPTRTYAFPWKTFFCSTPFRVGGLWTNRNHGFHPWLSKSSGRSDRSSWVQRRICIDARDWSHKRRLFAFAQSDKTGVDVGEWVVFVWGENLKLRPSFSRNRFKSAFLWGKDFFSPLSHLHQRYISQHCTYLL